MADLLKDCEMRNTMMFGVTRSGKTNLGMYEMLRLAKEEADRIKDLEDSEPIEIDLKESRND